MSAVEGSLLLGPIVFQKTAFASPPEFKRHVNEDEALMKSGPVSR